MDIDWGEFRSVIRRRANRDAVSEGTAAMAVMMLATMAMAGEIPAELRPALADAQERWISGRIPARTLEVWRVECWKFLESKNGNSTAVVDREDLAIRALICLLWDEADEGGDLDLGLEYFSWIAGQFGGLEEALGLRS